MIASSRFMSSLAPSRAQRAALSSEDRTEPQVQAGVVRIDGSRQSRLTFSGLMSAVIAVMRKVWESSVLMFVVVAMLTHLSIARLQAGKEADQMAELRQTPDAVFRSIDALGMPDSPERKERLKGLSEEIGQEIQRLQREYD